MMVFGMAKKAMDFFQTPVAVVKVQLPIPASINTLLENNIASMYTYIYTVYKYQLAVQTNVRAIRKWTFILGYRSVPNWISSQVSELDLRACMG